MGLGRVDVNCDWYALGVSAFELLAGTRPFDGGGPEVMVRKQTLAAPRLAELIPEVDRHLDEVVAGLLRRDPGSRFDGAEIRRQLVRLPVR